MINNNISFKRKKNPQVSFLQQSCRRRRLLPPFLSVMIIFVLFFDVVLSTTTPSPYEVLQSYNLPVGLLPKGSQNYTLDPTTGRFSAKFNGSCDFTLEGSYKIRYDPVITGYISPNRLRELKGISVKILFVWVGIVDVVRDGENLDFSVGIASAGFGIDNFSVCPQCGCGIDCGGEGSRSLRASA